MHESLSIYLTIYVSIYHKHLARHFLKGQTDAHVVFFLARVLSPVVCHILLILSVLFSSSRQITFWCFVFFALLFQWILLSAFCGTTNNVLATVLPRLVPLLLSHLTVMFLNLLRWAELYSAYERRRRRHRCSLRRALNVRNIIIRGERKLWIFFFFTVPVVIIDFALYATVVAILTVYKSIVRWILCYQVISVRANVMFEYG